MAKDYTAIRISKEARADAQAAKHDGETWDDYVRRCSNSKPADGAQVQLQAIADSLRRLEDVGQTIEGRLNTLESRLDDLEGNR